MNDRRFFVFNGIDGTTGKYLLPSMTARQISAAVQGELPPERWLQRLLKWWHEYTSKEHLGPVGWVDPKLLAETGWGVIFAQGTDPAVREALEPLLKLRREQASQQNGHFYRELVARPGESKRSFLRDYKVAAGQPADPRKLPYYLLIVGGPGQIPFSFQYQLGLEYAVGRIGFHTPDEYGHYARSVVEAETGGVDLPRRLTLFGVKNPDDHATRMSHDHLVGPLRRALAGQQDGWSVDAVLAEEATKTRLLEILGGDQTPAVLMTASHGVGFSKDHPLQLPHQGALVCQDWSGPKSKATPQVPYLAGEDIASDARFRGLLSFHLACYSAGTPELDSFADDRRNPEALASKPFIARLPRRLLGHPRGGALAVVGHVDRAWTYSFLGSGVGSQIQTYEATLRRLLDGHPLGSAMEYFGQRYAALSCDLQDELDEIDKGKTPDDPLLARLWAERNDARSFVILGDPAVRLPAGRDRDRQAE